MNGLANIGHSISDTSVRNILKADGIEPAPVRIRKTTWSTFLKAHWDVLATIDFATVEMWTKSRLVTYDVLFVMNLKSRRIHFAGRTVNPNGTWPKQIARNVTGFEGFLNGNRFLLMDRDTKFCEASREIPGSADVTCLRLPKRSPNLNKHMEGFMRSIKEEALRQLVLFGEASLRNAVRENLEHYHAERNHQGLSNELLKPDVNVGRPVGKLQQSERLGGMLRYYDRDAA